MSVEAHLSTLTTKHADLERQIDSELKSPLPDHLRVSQLKKAKLNLKDRISAMAE